MKHNQNFEVIIISLTEPEVIRNLKKFVEKNGLINGEKKIKQIFVHAHPTLIGIKELAPFHTIKIMGKYPDLLIELDDSSIVAIEAKGNKDFDKGYGQTIQYLLGSNYSYFAGDLKELDCFII